MRSNMIRCIGLELADIRNTKDYSIIEVSKKIDVNKDTISNYENGKSPMQITILEKLLNFYNVPVNIFFNKVYDRMQISIT